MDTLLSRNYFQVLKSGIKDNDYVVGTVLMHAALNGHLELVQYLVKHGTDVNAKYDSAFWKKSWTALLM